MTTTEPTEPQLFSPEDLDETIDVTLEAVQNGWYSSEQFLGEELRAAAAREAEALLIQGVSRSDTVFNVASGLLIQGENPATENTPGVMRFHQILDQPDLFPGLIGLFGAIEQIASNSAVADNRPWRIHRVTINGYAPGDFILPHDDPTKIAEIVRDKDRRGGFSGVGVADALVEHEQNSMLVRDPVSYIYQAKNGKSLHAWHSSPGVRPVDVDPALAFKIDTPPDNLVAMRDGYFGPYAGPIVHEVPEVEEENVVIVITGNYVNLVTE